MSDGHEIVTAPGLPEPVGFAHAVVPAGTEFVFLGGQTAQAPTGEIVGATIAEQFDQAAGNLVVAMRAAGCEGEHLVSLQIFCTDVAAYRDSTRELTPIWRKHFGRHYPAIGLFGVVRLYDEAALIELMGVAARISGARPR